ncbi:MAG: hypothetical protein KGN84_04350 [Acidobacteriota bacterium]|nr:hypothetical protein [Acidobacteriota bacterium]
MDVNQIIRELLEERKRLDRIIESLEETGLGGLSSSKPRSRRGRKFMDDDGRREVSQRMKRYWAARRAQKAGKGGDEQPVPKPEEVTRPAGAGGFVV